jgi:hypothetical protein
MLLSIYVYLLPQLGIFPVFLSFDYIEAKRSKTILNYNLMVISQIFAKKHQGNLMY